MNKAILIGNTGTAPEAHTFANGDKKVSVSLATSERWTDKQGQKQERTTWHNLEAFGKTAELMEQYVPKGTKLAVEGKIDVQSWDKDGVKQYKTVIRVDRMEFVGKAAGAPAAAPQAPAAPPVDDDLPF